MKNSCHYHHGSISSTIYKQLLHEKIPKVQKRQSSCQSFWPFWDLHVKKLLIEHSWNWSQASLHYTIWQCKAGQFQNILGFDKRPSTKDFHEKALDKIKVRIVGGSINKVTTWAIDLNVLYFLMLNRDVTIHKSIWACALDSERDVPLSSLRASESCCGVLHMFANHACNVISKHMNISVC